MNAQTILNRHPRVLRTVYFMAMDNRRNLYDVAAEYGLTRAEVKAFVDDFNRHGIDVPRPAGWQRPKATPASPSSKTSGESAKDQDTQSSIELRLADLERRVTKLERG